VLESTPNTNVIAATRDFVALSSVVYMTRCDNKFVLPTSPITENLQRCDRVLCTTCKGKEALYGHFYNNEWFLDSGVSAHFTPFESDFVSMTQGNYSRIEIANSKAPLFMVTVGTVLIEHEIIDPKDRTTRTAISKLWPVYCCYDLAKRLSHYLYFFSFILDLLHRGKCGKVSRHKCHSHSHIT